MNPCRSGFRPAVDRVVLGRGDRLEVFGIVALHAGDEGHAQLGGEKGIFAVGFLPAPPAGIAKDVDVGRPEIEAEEDAVVPFALRLVVLGASLGGDGFAFLVDHQPESHVAAMPMACGNTVAYPERATPCSASLHQS